MALVLGAGGRGAVVEGGAAGAGADHDAWGNKQNNQRQNINNIIMTIIKY